MLKKSIHTMIITMISRVLGLFRGTLVAYFFGASILTDAYSVSAAYSLKISVNPDSSCFSFVGG